LLNTLDNQTISLAGLFLTTDLVQSIATSGECDEANMRTVLDSLFNLEPDSVASVYGSKQYLRAGYQRMVDQLSGTQRAPNMQITHYTLNLLKLEQKCHAKPELMQRIRHGIESSKSLLNHHEVTDPEIVSALARIYATNISNISPQIVVHGNREYLETETYADQIRACLLAGVRAAVLWRQCGGSRWKVVFARQKYVNHAKQSLRAF